MELLIILKELSVTSEAISKRWILSYPMNKDIIQLILSISLTISSSKHSRIDLYGKTIRSIKINSKQPSLNLGLLTFSIFSIRSHKNIPNTI